MFWRKVWNDRNSKVTIKSVENTIQRFPYSLNFVELSWFLTKAFGVSLVQTFYIALFYLLLSQFEMTAHSQTWLCFGFFMIITVMSVNVKYISVTVELTTLVTLEIPPEYECLWYINQHLTVGTLFLTSKLQQGYVVIQCVSRNLYKP